MFTGDAVTTAFTLSRVPASVTSIVVFIDGVKQASIGGSGAYTLVGTTLNFTAAPPNNAVVEVIHLGVQSLVNVPADATVTANSLAPELRAITAEQFTANGTGTTFNLQYTPISSNSVIVTANGVVQYDYSLSGSTLILNFTPANGTLIRAAGMGNILTTGTITDDSVSTAKLQTNAVTTAKIADGSVTGPKIGLTAINANNIVDGGVTVAKGGTGLSTLTANSIVLGNGTDPVQLIAPGTTGNVLTSNGNNWISVAAAATSNYAMRVYTSTAPGQVWTKPAGLKAIRVTVIGGGGSGYPGASGGTSSFGSPALLSATGGGGTVSNGSNVSGAGSGGDINASGSDSIVVFTGACGSSFNGWGGASAFGFAGFRKNPQVNNNTVGYTYGGGGVSASGAGAGGGGAIEYIDAPALPGPQPFTVGAGGANPAPTPTPTRSTGGDGIVIVEEFY